MIAPEPGSRLAEMVARHDEARAEADEATERLKTITDAIKRELAELLVEGQTVIGVDAPGLSSPLRLARKTGWRLDTARLKREDPETYVAYAVETESWELRRVRRGEEA